MTRDGSRVSDYAYDLPPDRIARYPSEQRDGSRLLVVRPAPAPLEDLHFRDIDALFEAGDLLVVNESRVLPARLLGAKPTGADAQVLLTRPADPADETVWEALVRPGRKLRPGSEVIVSDDLAVEILDHAPGGGRLVRLRTSMDVDAALHAFGRMPLPPYIDRDAEALDAERYQTVYARTPGSVAAPTAGLHFTDGLLARLSQRGVARAAVTLHVGIGTFRPIEVEDPADHVMHHESWEVPETAARAVAEARDRGGRIWAVGTTAVRTLEAAADARGRVRPGKGTTDLFIRPPRSLAVVDGLITNFHLPQSTLLMLVASLAGYDRTMEAYRHAVARGYRFYSYGDAMVIPPRERAQGVSGSPVTPYSAVNV